MRERSVNGRLIAVHDTKGIFIKCGGGHMAQVQAVSSKSPSVVSLDEQKSVADSKVSVVPADWYRPISAEFSIPINSSRRFNSQADQISDDLLNDIPQHYDAGIAYVLAVIACWSYTDGPILSNKLSYYGLSGGKVTQFQVINNSLLVSATAFFILSADGKVGVLAFRGTEPENIISIMTDLSSHMMPFVGGEVHSGFYRNTEALWPLISEKIEEEHAKKLETIYITGHSLGGAMSVITTAKAQFDNMRWGKLIKGIYTYGQSMIGNDTFARLCQDKFGGMLYRHVYSRDIVPRLPTNDLGDFKHFGIQRFSSGINKPWSVIIDDQRTKLSRRVPRSSIGSTVAGVGFSYFESRIRRTLPIQKYISEWMTEYLWYSIDDHIPINYISACRASRN